MGNVSRFGFIGREASQVAELVPSNFIFKLKPLQLPPPSLSCSPSQGQSNRKTLSEFFPKLLFSVFLRLCCALIKLLTCFSFFSALLPLLLLLLFKPCQQVQKVFYCNLHFTPAERDRQREREKESEHFAFRQRQQNLQLFLLLCCCLSLPPSLLLSLPQLT